MRFNVLWPPRPNVRLLVVLTLILVTFALPSRALESSAVSSPRATVRLISNTDSFDGEKPLKLGLYFHLAEGWHIYWLNPGDAGEAPARHISGA